MVAKYTKLPTITGKDLIKLLQKDGWLVHRRTRHGIALVKKKDYWFGAEEGRQLGKAGLIDEICTTFPFIDALTAKD